MTKPALRLMTRADLDAVLSLEVALFGPEAWSRQMLTGELSQQPASRHYLVAEDNEGIVGYAGLLAAGGQADVLTIAVATSRWGQGIGTDLLAALLAEARRRGCTEVFLEVKTDNTRAQRLYHRWGFTEIGIRRGYYQPSGADAIVMRRDLAVAAEAELAQAGQAEQLAPHAARRGEEAR
jgi:ribosomal-protein-alanine N-acetyltransferase